jgi:tetratricopeptide (TPR) repeat protein
MLFNRKVKNWLLVSFYLLLFMPGQAQEKVLSHFASQDTARVMSLIKQGGFLIHSNIDSALVLLTEGMLLSKRAGFEDGIGYAMIYIGLAHTYNGDHNKGIDFYKKALPYCQNAKYIEDALPNLYIAMGASFIHHGDYIKANYFNYKSLLYMQKHMPNSQNLINPYVNMVFIQSKLGRHRQALEYGLVAKKLAIEKDLPLTLAKVFLNIGTQYTFLGQEDSAIYYFDSAAVLFQQHGLIDYQQAALTSIGDVMSQLGNYEQAIPYYKRSMQLSSTTSPLYGTIIPAYSLGIALFHLKKYKEAEVILVAGIEEATMTGFTQDKEKAHETLAQVYEAMGMYSTCHS